MAKQTGDSSITYLKRTPTWSATTEQHRLSLALENQHRLVKQNI